MGLKILVTKSSKWRWQEIRNYSSLEECVEELLSGDYFINNAPELVISKPGDWMPEGKRNCDCDYVVEIYDTWRE